MRAPPGAATSTLSPTSLPIRARAIGEEIEETLERADFTLVVELWFTDEPFGPDQQRCIESVCTRTLRLHFLPTRGLHDHVPLLFDYSHLAAVTLTVHAALTLDELLDRFRVIARGVYPAVLRDQGPAAALDEVAADLPRSVRLTGDLGGRLDWEIESGIYYVVAAAMGVLAGRRRFA